MKTSWQVATAAEAFTAAQFARCGWDVSVQYGANQPEYDLVAVDGDRVMKISVKGSQDGGWGLTQSFIKNADYHGAANKWLAKHSSKTIFCLVQLKTPRWRCFQGCIWRHRKKSRNGLKMQPQVGEIQFYMKSMHGAQEPMQRAQQMLSPSRGNLQMSVLRR